MQGLGGSSVVELDFIQRGVVERADEDRVFGDRDPLFRKARAHIRVVEQGGG